MRTAHFLQTGRRLGPHKLGTGRGRMRMARAACPEGVLLAALLTTTTLAALAQGPPDLLWTRAGHIGISSIALTPDGSVLAAASSGDNTIKLWTTPDGGFLRTLAAHYGAIHAVAISPDGALVASTGEAVPGSPDDNVKVWTLADGEIAQTFPTAYHEGWSVAFSPDGTLLAAGVGFDIMIWRLSDGALLKTLTGHSWFVFGLAFSPDGTILASASGDNTIELWSIPSGTPLRALTGHTFFVTSVAFSPDGANLVSGSYDSTVRLWRISDGAPLGTLTGHGDAVYAVAFSPDGSEVASGSGDATAKIWAFPGGALIRTLTRPDVHDINSVAFFPSGSTLATGGFDGKARLWSLTSNSPPFVIGYHTARVSAVVYSPDGLTVASASHDFMARLWKTSDGEALHTLVGHADVINSIDISIDGIVATGAGSPGFDLRDPTIKLWRLSDGALLRTLPGHPGAGTTTVAFQPDGQILASGGRDDLIKFWRTSDGFPLGQITADGGGVRVVAYSPDGTILASAGWSTAIKIWDAVTRALIRTIPLSASASSIAFSSDGTQLVVGLDAYGSNVELRRVSDGGLVQGFAGDENGFIHGVDISPDGETVASTSGYTYEIKLWDAASGSLLATYDRECGWGQWVALPIAFSPNGATFAYGRADASLALARNPFLDASAVPLAAGADPSGELTIRPNPSQGSSEISFALDAPRAVEVDILDVQGSVVRRIDEPHAAAGRNGVTWDGAARSGDAAPAGIYFVRILGDGKLIARGKLIRLKDR